MTLSSRRRAFLPIAMLAATCAALLVPANASAILVGMESNGELANSDRTPELQAAALDKMQAQGVRVVRANFAWNEIATSDSCATQTLDQLKDPNSTCYNWGLLDSLVELTATRKQQVLLSLTRVPAFVSKVNDPYWMGVTQAQADNIAGNYAAFMAAAGTRYRGKIPYWTIWNEPNSKVFWKPAPNAQRYAQLYAKAAVALRGANPTAKIAPGPTGPKSDIKPAAFMSSFQVWATKYLPGGSIAAKRKYINAWAHNPYPGVNQPSIAKNVPATWIGMATVDRIFPALDKSPLTKGLHVWATEFGFQTPPEFSGAVSIKQQAQFIAESYDWLDSKKRIDIGISYGLTDPVAIDDFQSGTFTAAGLPKASYFMFQRMISIPQGGTTGRVKKDTVVRVWGRSGIAPRSGKLVFRTPGKKCNPSYPVGQWCLVPKQSRPRATDGVMTAAMKLGTGTYEFAVYDTAKTSNTDSGYGPSRIIAAR